MHLGTLRGLGRVGEKPTRAALFFAGGTYVLSAQAWRTRRLPDGRLRAMSMAIGGAAGVVAGAVYHAGEVAVSMGQEVFGDGRPAPPPRPTAPRVDPGGGDFTPVPGTNYTESELAKKKRTVWCGGIPAEFATEEAIAQQMQCVGAVESKIMSPVASQDDVNPARLNARSSTLYS